MIELVEDHRWPGFGCLAYGFDHNQFGFAPRGMERLVFAHGFVITGWVES